MNVPTYMRTCVISSLGSLCPKHLEEGRGVLSPW